jgi:hypothetical protein
MRSWPFRKMDSPPSILGMVQGNNASLSGDGIIGCGLKAELATRCTFVGIFIMAWPLYLAA